jgi:hypothetical protein
VEAFRLYGIERVLIAYDRDEPGEKAASQLGERLMKEEGIECFRIQFPRNMDANEYALSVQPAQKSLGIAVRKAVWLGKGVAPSRAAKEEIPLAPFVEGGDEEARAVEACTLDTSFEKEGLEDFGLLASPVPPGPSSPSLPAVNAGEVSLTLGDRRWRVRGLEKNLSYEVLRVNVLVSFNDAFHVDTFDLYSARHRQAFLKQASEELSFKEEILRKDLGKVLLELETLQDAQIRRLQEKPTVTHSLSEEEQAAAMGFLKDPRLLDRVLEDFARCGVVGEETNKLVGYLSAVSRKLEEPLAIVIQSSSAAGKSSLMEAILSFFPAEELVKYSAMTGQSLFYMGETDLKHKILAIAEEEGAERASYALKLLQSEGELTIASTGKDASSGRLVTQEYHVEGPVMIFLTTTAVEIDEELLNRCIVLTVDEDREQTRAIHRLQRERQTLEGLLARQERDSLRALHRNAQRLLRPLLVANPYAPELTFLDDRTRTRRDHMKYLTLIRSIALLHQYQRSVKRTVHQGQAISYIEVTPQDIETANGLCHQVLGRSLDELAPQTRRLLVRLDEHVTHQCRELSIERCDYRFTQREVREALGLGSTQLKIHLRRLEELEYVLAHRGGRGQQFLYELAYAGEGQDGTPFLPRLLDVSQLGGQKYDRKRSGQNAEWSEGGRPEVGPKSGGGRGAKSPLLRSDSKGMGPVNGKAVKNAHLDEAQNGSYLQGRTDILPPLAADSGREAV